MHTQPPTQAADCSRVHALAHARPHKCTCPNPCTCTCTRRLGTNSSLSGSRPSAVKNSNATLLQPPSARRRPQIPQRPTARPAHSPPASPLQRPDANDSSSRFTTHGKRARALYAIASVMRMPYATREHSTPTLTHQQRRTQTPPACHHPPPPPSNPWAPCSTPLPLRTAASPCQPPLTHHYQSHRRHQAGSSPSGRLPRYGGR